MTLVLGRLRRLFTALYEDDRTRSLSVNPLQCWKYLLAWSSLSRYSRCYILPSLEKVAGKESLWNVGKSRQFARIRKIWDKSCPLWVQSTWLCAILMAKSACYSWKRSIWKKVVRYWLLIIIVSFVLKILATIVGNLLSKKQKTIHGRLKAKKVEKLNHKIWDASRYFFHKDHLSLRIYIC